MKLAQPPLLPSPPPTGAGVKGLRMSEEHVAQEGTPGPLGLRSGLWGQRPWSWWAPVWSGSALCPLLFWEAWLCLCPRTLTRPGLFVSLVSHRGGPGQSPPPASAQSRPPWLTAHRVPGCYPAPAWRVLGCGLRCSVFYNILWELCVLRRAEERPWSNSSAALDLRSVCDCVSPSSGVAGPLALWPQGSTR